MAAQYEVQSQRRSIKVLSQTETADVMEIGAVTKPHGVYYLVEVPYGDWLRGFAAFALGVPAEFIEAALSSGAAIGAYFVQEPDASGLLKNAVAFIVQVPNPYATQLGTQQTTIVVDYTNLPLTNDPAALFAAELAALAQTAAL